jgi:hypothetical protein
MKRLAIAVLLLAVCSALGQEKAGGDLLELLGQDVKGDAEKDGRDLGQQLVTKLEGTSFTGWSDIVEKEYGKHHYPETA